MDTNFIFDPAGRDEDAFLIKGNTFGVFDGANNRNNFFDKAGRSGGQLAAQIAKEAFALNDRPLKDLAVLANENIKNQMVSSGLDIKDALNRWHCIFAVVRMAEEYFEYIQLNF